MWEAGIRSAVLSRTGMDGRTGAAETAADLLVGYGWKAGTWANKSSQVNKWLLFCDEDGRDPLPATEGDVLAYLGYLYLEGRIGPTSVRQYLSAVTRFHETQGLEAPTRTPLVAAMVAAYIAKTDQDRPAVLKRIGITAEIAAQIVEHGIKSDDVATVGNCAAVIFAFVFQCRSVSVAHVAPSDIAVTSAAISVTLTHRKGKLHQRPLRLGYPANPDSTRPGPVDLMMKWAVLRPHSSGFFNLTSHERLGVAHLGRAMGAALELVGKHPPKGFFYASHSARIGGYNELLGLGFTDGWIMARLDWASPAMLQVYYDSSISVTAASRWLFAHMLPMAP